MSPIEVVQQYFKAMQGGPAKGEQLFALFAEDATYIEPFSGRELTHQGRSAIEQHLRSSWTNSPPDLELQLNRIDVDGEVVRSEWTCTSPAFPQPIHGSDVCTVREGRIHRLEVKFK